MDYLRQTRSKKKDIFSGIRINMTSEGHKYLGGVIGKKNYKISYTQKLVSNWVNQIKLMSEIAKSEPQAVYSAFTGGFISKFTYHLRVIDHAKDLLKPVDDVSTHHLIPAFIEGHVCSQKDRKLLALPVRMGGLAIPILTEFCSAEYQNSKDMCKNLSINITTQTKHGKGNTADQSNTKKKLIKAKQEIDQISLKEIRSTMNTMEIRASDLAHQKGASNWLTSLPLKQENFFLSKREFFDAIATRY